MPITVQLNGCNMAHMFPSRLELPVLWLLGMSQWILLQRITGAGQSAINSSWLLTILQQGSDKRS